ncbi:hypothetical protein NHX12_026056 [Muraenolepis orangiensis]|uniref:Uncharacterized protein n=1 Tax=Muraenolepis orangiensis TaxID=630683 RepID=A0A9Q0IQE9_9TELE|nr:hypothetical protein NHX12_026056 [Muraenolepis orangiensis]
MFHPFSEASGRWQTDGYRSTGVREIKSLKSVWEDGLEGTEALRAAGETVHRDWTRMVLSSVVLQDSPLKYL